MSRTAIILTALVAAGSVVAAVQPASAADLGDTRATFVHHADLDLTTDRGVAMLHRRIGYAAQQVCGSFHPGDLAARGRALACRKQSVADAAQKVELTVAAARSGERYAGGIAVMPANP